MTAIDVINIDLLEIAGQLFTATTADFFSRVRATNLNSPLRQFTFYFSGVDSWREIVTDLTKYWFVLLQYQYITNVNPITHDYKAGFI